MHLFLGKRSLSVSRILQHHRIVRTLECCSPLTYKGSTPLSSSEGNAYTSVGYHPSSEMCRRLASHQARRQFSSSGSNSDHDTIPDPRQQASLYNSQLSYSTVLDPAGLLSYQEGSAIEKKIHEIEGMRITVLLLRSLTLEPGQDPELAAEALATQLHNTWGIGDASKQDGVLILLSANDRVVHFSVGTGVENRLLMGRIKRIIEGMKVSLDAKKYGDALLSAVTHAGASEDYMTAAYDDRRRSGVALFFIALLAAAFLLPARDDKSKTQEGALKLREVLWLLSILREEEEFRPRTVCPHCLQNKVSSEAPTTSKTFRCGHAVCLPCADSKLKSSCVAGVCPVCKDTTGTADGYIATTEEVLLSRSSDVLYRLRRMRSLYPGVMPASLLRSMEAKMLAGDYSGARKAAEDRLLQLEKKAAEQDREVNRASTSTSSEARDESSRHYGGGGASPTAGQGGTGKW